LVWVERDAIHSRSLALGLRTVKQRTPPYRPIDTLTGAAGAQGIVAGLLCDRAPRAASLSASYYRLCPSHPDRGRVRHHVGQPEIAALEQQRRTHDRRNGIG
jgi:hypothetical protein